MGREVQKRGVRERQIPSENRSRYRGTEDKDRRRDTDRETRNKDQSIRLTHKETTDYGLDTGEETMDRQDRETEERRKNGKYCQIYHIVPSCIIHV